MLKFVIIIIWQLFSWWWLRTVLTWLQLLMFHEQFQFESNTFSDGKAFLVFLGVWCWALQTGDIFLTNYPNCYPNQLPTDKTLNVRFITQRPSLSLDLFSIWLVLVWKGRCRMWLGTCVTFVTNGERLTNVTKFRRALSRIMSRYYAVVHPMKAQYLCTTSQVYFILL